MSETITPHPQRADQSFLTPQLVQAAGEDFLEAVSANDMDELALRPGGLLSVIRVLREHGFNHLLDVGGTDHHPLSPRFEVSYILTAIPLGDQALSVARDCKRFRLRVFPDDRNPVVPTLADLWPSADWPEREVFDLFGVHFEGHPELRRILNPDDWKGHPLRKDYPLRGLERRFVPGGRVGSIPPLKES